MYLGFSDINLCIRIKEPYLRITVYTTRIHVLYVRVRVNESSLNPCVYMGHVLQYIKTIY